MPSTTKPVEHQKKHVAPNRMELSKSAGGNISQYPTEFTKDSKYFFSSVGNCVKIFSMATGAVVKVLSQSPATGGHSSKVTRVILNPKNHLQLYTASLDGTIKLWDYNDDILLKTFNVNAPIESMVISPGAPEHAYIITKAVEGNDNTIVYRFTFGGSDKPTHMRRICSLRDCNVLDITDDGKWLAFAARYKAYVWPINKEMEDVVETQINSHVFVEYISTLKFHPHKPVLAVGDRSGRITHINNYKSTDSKEHIRSVHHWHHLPVRCLTFMADGSYLLSGGEESVMVIWQLDTGHKQFLPRMGGSIASITISPNHRFYCLGLDDNSLRLVNGVTHSIEQVIQGLQYAQAENVLNPLSTGLIIEPRNQHVVLNGVQGSLQFYDVHADSHVMDLEVVPMNRIVRAGEKEIIHAHVAHVAFLKSGEWMATVDMRDDKVTTPELFLKFWRWNPDTQAYQLHTRVDYPHSKPITSLTFNPVSRQGPMAITTSEDKTFKVWNLSSDLGRSYQRDDSAAAWVCRSVGVYRDNVPSIATFSEDGSILAVAFGQVITVWDPYSNSIQAVLAQPNPENVEKLGFLGENCPYLIAKSKTHLYVWNMLTCKVWWSYKISLDHLAIDTVNNQFAIVRNHPRTNEARVTIFDPSTPVPIALQHLNYTCLSIAWLSKDQEDTHAASNLVCLSDKYEMTVHTISSNTTKQGKTQVTAVDENVSLENTNERNLLNEMYGLRVNERETEEQTRLRLKTAQTMREEAMSSNKKEIMKAKRENGDILSAPSHVLPGVEVLFDSFMSSLMSLRLEQVEPVAMELDQQEQQEQDTKENQDDLELVITQSSAIDFPSLSTYFSNELEKTPATQHTQSSSSSDDDSEDEDPSKMDW